MKILVAGGGTGGHIYPGISVANEVKHRHSDWDIEFVGRHDSIEGRVVPDAGYVIHHLHVAGFERYYSVFEKASVAGRLLISIKDSFKLLRRIKPDFVIGTGGYVCGPVVLAAAFKKIPTLICEQNVIPGFTIKILSRYALTICTSFKETAQYMHHPERCVLTGNPVRREFSLYNREIARKSLKLKESVKFILCFGGSAGAKTINDAAAQLILEYAGIENTDIYHVTGIDAYKDFMNQLTKQGFDPIHKNITVASYSNDMPMLLNAADLVIARSGATTISEINYVGVPAIYCPYPYAAEDHQMKNAKVTEKNGASIVISDGDMNGDVLIKTVKNLLMNDTVLTNMALQSKKLGVRNSAQLVCDQIEKLLKNNSDSLYGHK